MTSTVPLTGSDLRALQRFDAVRWTRAIYVELSNVRVAPLVQAGLLEMRDDPHSCSKGMVAKEYRLTVRGTAVVLAANPIA